MPKVVIRPGRPGRPEVELDGADVSALLHGATIRLEQGCLPTVELELVTTELHAEGLDGARLLLPRETVDLLTRYGWTPPDHAGGGGLLMIAYAPAEATVRDQPSPV